MKRIAVIGPDAAEGRLAATAGPEPRGSPSLKYLREPATQRSGPCAGCERTVPKVILVPAACLSHEENGLLLPGLKGEYFDNVSLAGIPAFTRTDSAVRFRWTLYGPDPERLSYGFYSVR